MEKIISSVTIPRDLKKKASRLAHILGISESSFIENAIRYYVEKSNVAKEALKKATANTEYSQELVNARAKIAEAFGNPGTKNYSGATIISETSLDGKTKM